jgi:hypothetical protein
VNKIFVTFGLALAMCISCTDKNTGTTVTGNNGIIVAHVDIPSILAKMSAVGENPDYELHGFLYKQNYPYDIYASKMETNVDSLVFTDLPEDKYALRIDVNGRHGGLFENIEVDGNQVKAVVPLDTYVKQGQYVGIKSTEISEVISEFGVAFTEIKGDTLVVKTLGEFVENSTLVITDSQDTLRIDHSSAISTTPSSSDLVSSSQELISSSFFIDVSSSSSISEPTADTLTIRLGLDQIDDASVDILGGAASSLGLVSQIITGQSDDNSTYRSLIRINLDDSMNVDVASKVSLILTSCTWYVQLSTDPITLEVYKVLANWGEESVTGNERTLGVAWGTVGLGMDGVDASSINSTQATINPPLVITDNAILRTNVEFDITTLMKEWNADPSSNHGLLIKNKIENLIESERPHLPGWCSSEENFVDHRPTIRIEY